MDRSDLELVALEGGERARLLMVELVDQVGALRGEVEELKRQLGRDSRNSSRPPSADPPVTRQQRRKLAREKAKQDLAKRRQGAQPGHEGASRQPAEPERLTAGPIDVAPLRCACGHCFTGAERQVGEPEVHQQWDLPPIVPEIVERRLLRLACPVCGTATLAELPDGVLRSSFGIRLHAAIALLAGALRASRTLIAQHVSRVLGIEISAGGVDAAIRRVSLVLHDPWRELDEAIKRAEVVYADETTWLTKADPCLLWVAASTAIVCFRIDPRRTQEAARKLLGADFGGFVVSDRYVGYHWLDVLQQQLCWSHLVRQLRSLSERDGAPGKLGARLLAVAGDVFKAHRAHADAHRAEHPDAPELVALREHLKPLRERFRVLLEDGKASADTKTSRFCAGLLEEYDALWTFCDVPGVDPTNNEAERQLRHAVIMRRISGGSQSQRGNRWTERILSVIATCRKQDIPVYQYLVDAISAFTHKRPIPTLVPG